jgi:hypothetical protein
MWFVLFLWTEFIYAHCLYMCSLSLHMLTIFRYVMLPMMLLSILFSLLLSLCFVANDVALYLTFINSEPMPLCKWSFECYTIWALLLSLSSLPMACDEIVQLQKLFRIWADVLELVRNLASLPAALLSLSICSLFLWCLYAPSSWSNDHWHVLRPTVFVDMLTIFYRCSPFLWCLYAPSSWSNDDWHVLRPTAFVDMLTVFIDAHCVYIW